jgi:tRNA A-37 threonylcarbamoyl transferase component Bud32
MEGLPRLLARVGKSGFIMERIEARRLPKDDDPPPPPIYFERAEALIGAMHERGVAHGDLRRKNLFIDDGARPWVIDFGTAVVREAGLAGAVSRFLFERVALADRLKLARLQGEYLPDSLSDEQRRAIARTPFYFRLGQWFRHRIVRPLKPRRRRRLWRRLRRRLKSKSR